MGTTVSVEMITASERCIQRGNDILRLSILSISFLYTNSPSTHLFDYSSHSWTTRTLTTSGSFVSFFLPFFWMSKSGTCFFSLVALLSPERIEIPPHPYLCVAMHSQKCTHEITLNTLNCIAHLHHHLSFLCHVD